MSEREMKFGSVSISTKGPVVVIAEAACEHLGSLEVAQRMADAAKEVGADIIKYQLHLPDEMIPGSITFWGGSMDEVLAKYNLSIKDHEVLIGHCENIGIQYLCTPFCAKAADILDELGVPAFKIGSGEMTNIPMMRHIARKRKPMIVSTGMATVDEISETIAALEDEGADFALTNCTSAYPPRYDQINLGLIPKMEKQFGVLVGHSDHTPEIWTGLAAVAVGACMLEKHFTLSRALKGPDHHISLEPEDFAKMVTAIRKIEKALGAEKKVYEEEEEVRSWAHHSVVSLELIEAGSRISPAQISVKRPGGGVPAKHLSDIYGCVSARDIPPGTVLQWRDLVEGKKINKGD